jgi:hypothetical protein
MLKAINLAYEVLSDPGLRREHDAWIASNEENGTGSGSSMTSTSGSGENGSEQSGWEPSGSQPSGSELSEWERMQSDVHHLHKKIISFAFILTSFAAAALILIMTYRDAEVTDSGSHAESSAVKTKTVLGLEDSETNGGLLEAEEILREFGESNPAVLGGRSADPRPVPPEVTSFLLKQSRENHRGDEKFFATESLNRTKVVVFLDFTRDGNDDIIALMPANLGNYDFVFLEKTPAGYKYLKSQRGHSIYFKYLPAGLRFFIVRDTQMGDKPDMIYVFDVERSSMAYRGNAYLIDYELVGPLGFGSAGEALGWQYGDDPVQVQP